MFLIWLKQSECEDSSKVQTEFYRHYKRDFLSYEKCMDLVLQKLITLLGTTTDVSDMVEDLDHELHNALNHDSGYVHVPADLRVHFQHILDLRLVPEFWTLFSFDKTTRIDYGPEISSFVLLVDKMSCHFGCVQLVAKYDEFWEFVHRIVCRPELPKTAFGHSLVCKLLGSLTEFVPSINTKQAKMLFDDKFMACLSREIIACHWRATVLFVGAALRSEFGRSVFVKKLATAGEWYPTRDTSKFKSSGSLKDNLWWMLDFFNMAILMCRNFSGEVRPCPLEACFTMRSSVNTESMEELVTHDLELIVIVLLNERKLSAKDLVLPPFCNHNNYAHIMWNLLLRGKFDLAKATQIMHKKKTSKAKRTCWNWRCKSEKTQKFKHCSRCNEAYYCSSECQKTHWKEFHRRSCVKS
eukprot:405584_1